MKKLIVAFVIVLSSHFAFSQIAATKDQIIDAYGKSYKEVELNSNEFYLMYEVEYFSSASGAFHQQWFFYFLKGDGSNPLCFYYVIQEPKTEYKANVKESKKLFIQLDKTVFLDKQRGYIVELKLNENQALQVWNLNYDFNSSITGLKQKYKQRRKDEKKSERQRKRDQRKIKAAEGTYFG
jgi:hypothetical protein